MITKNLKFKINRCNDEERRKKGFVFPWCYGDDEIDEFISDLEVSVFTVSKHVDFTVYETEPSKIGMVEHGRSLLEKDSI